MSGFLFAFLAVLLAGAAARDQALLARLTVAQGRRPLLLLVALFGALATSVFSGWVAARLLPETAGSVRAMLGAIALVVAGLEMVVFGPPRAPAEPTNSLFAAFLVMCAWQVGDAARLLILALGVATASPVPVVLGGVLASAAHLTLGWMLPPLVDLPALRRARRMGGVALMLVGAVTFIA